MEKIIKFLSNNKEWLFSGIGVLIVQEIRLFFKNRKIKDLKNIIDQSSSGNNISQSFGNNSSNNQVAGNNINNLGGFNDRK